MMQQSSFLTPYGPPRAGDNAPEDTLAASFSLDTKPLYLQRPDGAVVSATAGLAEE